MKLEGADELRARLVAIEGIFPAVSGGWSDAALRNMQARIYSPSGRMRRSLHTRAVTSAKVRSRGPRGWQSTAVGATGASVWGDWRVIFIDRGRKFSEPKEGKALRFTLGDRTVYTRKGSKRVRPRPFIKRSATDALRANPFAMQLIVLWNQGGRVGATRLLGRKRYIQTPRYMPKYLGG